MKIVPEVIGTSRTTMTIKYTKKADLWPLNIKINLVLGLKNIQNN